MPDTSTERRKTNGKLRLVRTIGGFLTEWSSTKILAISVLCLALGVGGAILYLVVTTGDELIAAQRESAGNTGELLERHDHMLHDHERRITDIESKPD